MFMSVSVSLSLLLKSIFTSRFSWKFQTVFRNLFWFLRRFSLTFSRKNRKTEDYGEMSYIFTKVLCKQKFNWNENSRLFAWFSIFAKIKKASFFSQPHSFIHSIQFNEWITISRALWPINIWFSLSPLAFLYSYWLNVSLFRVLSGGGGSSPRWNWITECPTFPHFNIHRRNPLMLT